MMFAGQIAGHGVSGSGTLSIQATNIRVDGLDATAPLELPVDTLVLDAGFFNKGFGHYSIIGVKGLTVEEGTQIDVTRPVYRFNADSQRAATGARAADALDLWTPTLHQEDPIDAVLNTRPGARHTRTGG